MSIRRSKVLRRLFPLAFLTAFAAPAASATLQDGITLNAVPSDEPAAAIETAVAATGTGWVSCAKEGKTCSISASDVVTIRYGEGDNFTFFVAKGLSGVPCKNFWGDPSKGNNKACSYIASNLLDASPDSSFKKVVSEGQKFFQGAEGLFWVRYGHGSKWVYTLIQGGSQQEMPCNNSYFGFDPYKGTNKECQIGGAFTLGVGEMTECATEGNNCTIGSSPVLAKYGTGSGFDFRFVRESGEKMSCNNNFFGVDPKKGDNKRCYYQDFSPKDVETLGQWKQVLSCEGPDCPVSTTISVGTTRSNSWTTTNQWGETVTTSMEAGFSIEGVGAKVSTSVATSYSHSEAFTNALSTTVSQSFTASCDPKGEASKRAIYQFRTSTTESCLETGSCNGATQTAQYVCAVNAPTGYAGPQCVPGYCSDALCTVCDYPGDSS